MKGALAILILVTACGRVGFDPVGDAGSGSDITNPPPADFVDGTRLRAKAWMSGDAAQFLTWHDDLIDDDCFLLAAADGAMRCLPSNTSVQQSYFGDAACTQRIASRLTPSSTCNDPSYAVSFDTAGSTVYAVTGLHSGQIYSNLAGCSSMAVGSGSVYFDIGAVIPSSMFVAGHEERTRNHDLSYVETVFDDGARVLASRLFDEARGEYCSPTPVTADTAICLPGGTQYGGFAFRDAACTQGVLVSTTDSDMPIVLEGSDLCGDRLRAFRRGAPYTGSLFAVGASGCTPYSGQQAYEAIPTAPDAYYRFQRAVRPGSGRVHEARWTSTDGLDVVATTLWDAQRGAWCEPILDTSTQTAICAPWSTPLAATVYPDATCSTGFAVDPACAETGGGQRRAKSTPPYVSCETFFSEVHLYDQPVALPLYQRSLDGCVLTDASTSVFGIDEATAAPAASYAPLELR
ncbi:hypothetical protein BH11MYX2_BH11MYX2_31250 [soil metagenome]